jgi:hypothetical protein
MPSRAQAIWACWLLEAEERIDRSRYEGTSATELVTSKLNGHCIWQSRVHTVSSWFQVTGSRPAASKQLLPC